MRITTLFAMFLGVAALQDPAKPQIKTGVELVLVDAQVVDKDGKPSLALGVPDFDVTIDGKSRKVVSVEIQKFGEAASAVPGTATVSTSKAPRRLYLLAIDEFSFRPASAKAAVQAATKFVDKLGPNDLVGLQAYPTSATHVDFTTEHAEVTKALGTVTGLYDAPHSQYNMSVSDVIDITGGDVSVEKKIADRECRGGDLMCPQGIKPEANGIMNLFENFTAQSIGGLRGLLNGLAAIPERKYVILVSGGLLGSDREGGRPNFKTELVALGREAAMANSNLYVLHMDTRFLDAFSADNRKLYAESLFRESTMFAQGLDLVAGSAGGAVMRVEAGNGDYAFDRVLRETSAYYLVGVEPTDADRDGKSHIIGVKVKPKGLSVRSRKTLIVPAAGK